MEPRDIENPIAEEDFREQLKIYCCGWCGSPCHKDGSEYQYEIPEDYNPNNYEKVNGHCCADEQQRICNMNQVTRDMAIDAGDLDLEGTWI